MTDKEIIKALECCKTTIQTDCENCPLYKEEVTENSTCITILSENALDLINRQQAEIERLQKAIKVQDIMIEQQDYKLKQAKSEAIKDFADMLKGQMFNEDFLLVEPCFMADIIDNLAKEMVGD